MYVDHHQHHLLSENKNDKYNCGWQKKMALLRNGMEQKKTRTYTLSIPPFDDHEISSRLSHQLVDQQEQIQVQASLLKNQTLNQLFTNKDNSSSSSGSLSERSDHVTRPTKQ